MSILLPFRPLLPAGLLLAALCGGALAHAQPYTPPSDDTPLEARADAGRPELEALRLRAQDLARHPDDAAGAAEVARGYLRLARRDADPRLIGHARAALQPWWDAAEPPAELLFLRASLKQTVHQFDAALADLQHYLGRRELAPAARAQALLTRSTVLGVLGRSAEARQDCNALPREADRATRMLCAAQIDSYGGSARRTLALLEVYFRQGGFGADPAIRLWGDLIVGDCAARLDQPALAEQAYRAALAEDPGDSYSLGAYADFLLDQGHADQVRTLLAPHLRADGLLLRHAIALRRLGDAGAAAEADEVGARFAAARESGDHTHKREEARYRLALRGDAAAALRLAEENWAVQREPADLRILAEAALAAHDAAGQQLARAWLRRTGLSDLASEAVRALQPAA